MQSGRNGRKTKVNTIFVVIKFDNRFERMMTGYLSIEELVKKYTDKVVVMISHWDYSKSPEKDFNDICELFEEECPSIVNFISYYNQHLNGELADLMFSCISNMKSDLLILAENESALDNKQNTNEILEEALPKNEYQNTGSIREVKSNTSQEKSRVIIGVSGEVETEKSTQGDSSEPLQQIPTPDRRKTIKLVMKTQSQLGMHQFQFLAWDCPESVGLGIGIGRN